MRIHPRATAQRSVMNFGRVSFSGAHNDQFSMQQFEGTGMSGEGMKNVERPQNYGFRSVPMAADGDGAPEGHMFSHGGNPSHRIIGAVEDRRHSPYKMPAGSSFQYNANGEGTYIDPEKGTFMLAGGYGKNAEKARSSLRHVEKQKQPREFKSMPNHGSGGGGGGQGGGAGGQGQQEKQYSHQGEKPSSELFTEKGRVFGTAEKSLFHSNKDGLYTLIDDKHVAIFANKETVAWMDKDAGMPFVTKPWQVKSYSHKKPEPSSEG